MAHWLFLEAPRQRPHVFDCEDSPRRSNPVRWSNAAGSRPTSTFGIKKATAHPRYADARPWVVKQSDQLRKTLRSPLAGDGVQGLRDVTLSARAVVLAAFCGWLDLSNSRCPARLSKSCRRPSVRSDAMMRSIRSSQTLELSINSATGRRRDEWKFSLPRISTVVRSTRHKDRGRLDRLNERARARRCENCA